MLLIITLVFSFLISSCALERSDNEEQPAGDQQKFPEQELPTQAAKETSIKNNNQHSDQERANYNQLKWYKNS